MVHQRHKIQSFLLFDSCSRMISGTTCLISQSKSYAKPVARQHGWPLLQVCPVSHHWMGPEARHCNSMISSTWYGFPCRFLVSILDALGTYIYLHGGSAIQKGGDCAVHLFFFESPPNVTEPTAMDQHWAFACSSGSPSATASSNWQRHADITDEIEFETQQTRPTFAINLTIMHVMQHHPT